ncbi:predicted protein [Nematostella vectensis]|uniref:Cytoplasmic tRNA 2-thiolation protein 2 n=1 Tax=Nematostella vectensis TaxID=45351 RepID=A7S1L5_NEMVE|nr:predicted protein [Nematostella vectensis]|eukprot:XP_001634444.1 predicted protein [Nematostella vectensis]
MCSIGDDGLEEVPSKPPRDATQRMCMKCSSSLAVVVVRLNDPLCKDCFLAYCTHKFRSTIGKARVIRHNERVLLAVSGGPASLAMLHFISEATSARRLRFHPDVVFINNGAIIGVSTQDIVRKIHEVTMKAGFALHVVGLETLFRADKMSPEESLQALQTLFDSVTSLTAKEDLLRSLHQQLLVKVAMDEGYSRVMVGDSANNIAVHILSDISQGRGGALPFITAFNDSRHDGISILRPMREFIAKEICLYNHFMGIDAISTNSLATKAGINASINKLTEEFISGLQAQFPFTVSTVFRTGDKLSLSEEKCDIHCAICKVPVSSADRNLCKRLEHLAINHSHRSDSSPPSNNIGSACSSDDTGGSPHQSTSLKDMLCYGCQLTLKDVKQDITGLPFVQDCIQRISNREVINSSIQEFLLPDDKS